MMEHIRQFDWYTPSTPEPYFVSESALDNCNVEAIVMDRFNDPLWSSSEEDEEEPLIDWDDVFKTKNFNKNHRLFVPGMHRVAPYPKLSAMTGQQHYRALRVLCAMNPSVLEEMQFHSPTMVDRHNFEQLKEIYDQEKKEYIEWAKTQWVTHHCVRALRPKPVIETTYEAEFKVRAQRLSGYPKRFEMAAQIPLECTRGNDYKTMLKETLIDVPVSDMPQAHLPKPIMRNSTIITPCSLPEPCHKHPYQFILPNENSVSILPIKEVHRELAQYAADNGTRFIASENALRCLVEFNRSWNIPITVCSAFNNEGERVNVVVLDSEILASREPAARRTFRAYRHLLEHALVPSSEIQARINKVKSKQQQRPARRSAPAPRPPPEPDCSSDDEPLGLCILEESEVDLNTQDPTTLDTAPIKKTEKKSRRNESHDGAELTSPERKNNAIANGEISREDIDDIIGIYNCTCSDTLYEIPPPRSFKKWQFTNNNSLESIDVIVHCSHKARLDSTELVLEPIPEYQLELGGSEQPPDRIRSIALSLLLRNNASVLNARVDGYNGDMVTLDALPPGAWQAAHEPVYRQVDNVLHTALAELQGLVPGYYMLQHEPSHGSNALLLVARHGTGDATLELECDLSQSGDVDEAAMARAPPTLAPVLLPYHKFRKILPCAFTPYEHFLAKEPRKPPSKQKSPPQAIQWPKRKNRKRKQKN